MAVTVRERVISPRGTRGQNAEAELIYWIEATGVDEEDYDAVATAVQDDSPETFDDLARANVQCEHEGGGTWFSSVTYQVSSSTLLQIGGDSVYNFDTTGGTQHITHSIQTIDKKGPTGRQAPDNKQAIGATATAVEGCDIVVPIYHFSETHIVDDDDVTAGYKLLLSEMTGTVNNAVWKGYQIGEVLFLGAVGTQRGNADWEITYRFAASLNKTGIVVGDVEPIDKKGWEYFWVLYEPVEDTGAIFQIENPRATYVEKVYELDTFADLNIGI